MGYPIYMSAYNMRKYRATYESVTEYWKTIGREFLAYFPTLSYHYNVALLKELIQVTSKEIGTGENTAIAHSRRPSNSISIMLLL